MISKQVYKIISNIAYFLIILILFTWYLLPILGINTYVVKSSSMEPEIRVGSIVFVNKINPNNVYNEIKIGDDITYYLTPNTIITHRVVSIDEQNDQIRTKGIANQSIDATILKKDKVIGKVNFSIPYIGYLLNIYAIVILSLVILFVHALNLLKKELINK